MKICVFGAGAIGGFLAAVLHRAGQDVSLVVRGATLEAIRSQGLRVTWGGEETVFSPPCSDDPAALGVQDAVVVTTKATAVAQVARTIAPLLGPRTPVAFVMNGIPWWYFHGAGGAWDGQRLERLDPGGAAWDRIGPGRVIGGVVNAPCTTPAPGVVQVGLLSGKYDLTLGEPTGGITPRLEALVAAFGNGPMQARATDRIRAAIWSKLVLNLTSGPISALTGARMKDIFSSAVCADARRRMHAEAQAIAAAMGWPVQIDVEPAIAAASRSDHRASMAQDMRQKRPLELDAMAIVPLEFARRHGIATPTLDLVVELARVRAVEEGLYPR